MVVGFIEARDPGSRLQFAKIPLSATFPTQGRDAYLTGCPARAISVCMLFYRGRCKSQKNCRQLHVNSSALDEIRDEAAGACCAKHGNEKCPRGDILIETESGCVVRKPLLLFAPTNGLRELLASGSTRMEVQESRLCGLNKVKRCRWGEGCMHLHLCRRESVEPKHEPQPAQSDESSLDETNSEVTDSDSESSDGALEALTRFAASFQVW